ncbi:MAG TPA: SMP-30/gluconolactonase/LRE family protein [Chitinophagaceae bacterium]|nr:SMP-30/gluconolactonase/LRE family protein [Chitinophagaceae bacterium]
MIQIFSLAGFMLLLFIEPIVSGNSRHTCLSTSRDQHKQIAMIRGLTKDTFQKNIISDDTPVLVSNQFSFTEGPAADEYGNVFFTDQPNNKIWEYDTAGRLSLFMDNAGRPNGMYFDEQGNLIACADEHNELWSITPDKKVTVLVKNYDGNILNGPNDVWVNHRNGDIYFTDPYYPRDYWAKDHQHLTPQNVYYLKKGTTQPVVADDRLTKPNGIIGTPDGKFLFIADIGGNKVYKYEIGRNGALINKKKFIDHGSDGLTLDADGNLYITGKGVTVFNQEGKMIQRINIPEEWTGNICFGGKDLNYLFITASKSVYRLNTKVKGIR